MKYHLPVLSQEVGEWVQELSTDAVLVDATVGEGGHSALLLDSFPVLQGVGVDADSRILERARVRLQPFIEAQRMSLVHDWYDSFFSHYPLGMHADIILFDLAISTYHYHFDDRGFSFDSEDVIDMRLDISAGESAARMLARMNERDIRDMIYRYGEDPLAPEIARKIVGQRVQGNFTARALATLVKSCYPPKRRHRFPHPATRTFQAIRIAVNRELERLASALHHAIGCLKKGGRIMVISFHSLEDRMVKHFFRQHAMKSEGTVPSSPSVLLQILTKKPIYASEAEIQKNSAARSAKLRIAQRLI